MALPLKAAPGQTLEALEGRVLRSQAFGGWTAEARGTCPAQAESVRCFITPERDPCYIALGGDEASD